MTWTAMAHGVDEEVATLYVRADPNGLAYDRRADALYVADTRGGAVVRVDRDQHRRIARIDRGGVVTGNRLGGLAAAADGTLYVTRLGAGRAGAIFRVERDGQVTELPELAPKFWRLGVSYDAEEHALYTTQYLKSTSGPFDGSIVRVDLDGGRVTSVIDGFVKPVGVAKLGSTLVVTDARLRAVFRVELVNGVAFSRTRLARDVDRPDSVCACDPYSVLVTSFDETTRRGSVRQLWLDGRTRVVASGAWEPRGVTSDGERVFVAARRTGRILVFRL